MGHLCDITLTACPSLCREGLIWVDINWMDNGECLDLIEKVCYGHDVIRYEIQTYLVRNMKIRVKKWVESESSVSVPSANMEGAGPPDAFP